MHVSFDETNPSKEDNIVCNDDDDDEILEGPQENTSKDQPIHQE